MDKGFKLHIKNHKNSAFTEGGFITLLFYMKIVNPSPILDTGGNPVYKNTASYYAQEIPTCRPGDQNCVPIKDEKTKIADINRLSNTVDGVVEEGVIGADVDNYSNINILKQDKNNKALKGAKFTIYTSNENQEKLTIATNKNNENLENLVTNDLGKLCKKAADGTLKEVSLTLKRGYYIISELSAPEGYKITKTDTFIIVSYRNEDTIIINEQIPRETERETPRETEQETPTESEKEIISERETKSQKELKDTVKKKSPNTGDVGILIPIASLIISAAASFVLAKKKNK